MKYLVLIIFLCYFLSACDKSHSINEEQHAIISESLNLPKDLNDYTPRFPQSLINEFPEIEDALNRDEIHDHLATMGRVLFYDKRLSRNNTVSCATCHKQELAFSDDSRVSLGINDRAGSRNTLALGSTMGFESSYGQSFNLPVGGAFAQFSWDDTVFDLTEQSSRAIESDVEMDMTLSDVVRKLSVDRAYGVLMKNAFGTSQISEHNLLFALKSFMISLSSVNSKFDEGMDAVANRPGVPFPNFSDSENLGKRIFNSDCASCHGNSHTFATISASNNGLEMSYEDSGKGEITKRSEDIGVFKVPFLRNIEVTAPYMHDGRFATLRDVVDHYSENIQPHLNLGFALRDVNDNPRRFNYSVEEKSALVDYLKTLTDHEFLEDNRFSNPFN